MYVHDRILCCLNIATQEFTWKKWVFKQSAAPTLATLAGAANGLRPLAARGLAGKNYGWINTKTGLKVNYQQIITYKSTKIMQFDWFLSVLEQKPLENHEIYYIGAAELP